MRAGLDKSVNQIGEAVDKHLSSSTISTVDRSTALYYLLMVFEDNLRMSTLRHAADALLKRVPNRLMDARNTDRVFAYASVSTRPRRDSTPTNRAAS
jgi:hypothetical protein